MADEDNRHPVVAEAAQRREQRLHLLRHEHRGRLVEDEHLAVAVERLQDLDALLLADGEAVDARPGIRADAEPLRRLGHLLRGDVEPHARAVGRAEDDVLGHGHRLHEREVLRDHPDPGRDRVLRRVDRHGPPVDEDVPASGRVSP